MAKSLGYKDKIRWDNILEPYIPQWMALKRDQEEKFKKIQLLLSQAWLQNYQQNQQSQMKMGDETDGQTANGNP